MPVFDIIGSLWAAGFVFKKLKSNGIRFVKVKFGEVIITLKESFVYFSSNIATTVFNGFNTVVIGFMLSSTQVAYWGICLQIIGAIQGLYSPISDAIYPHMVRSKNIEIIKKFLYVLVPVSVLGSSIVFELSKGILRIVSGSNYEPAASLLRLLTPILVVGLISIIMGWPSLGAIGKQKQTTISTVLSALFQIVGIIILLVLKQFTLTNIAILRVLTECLLAGIRISYTLKFRDEFNHEKIRLRASK
jgi:PST family polysaccharide transporter